MKKIKITIITIILPITILIAGYILTNHILKDNNVEKNTDPDIVVDKIEPTNIELNTSTWITPLVKNPINTTEDTLLITTIPKIPSTSDGETSSWTQNINYTITCNNIEYNGSIIIDSNSGISYEKDDNPFYDIELINFNNNSILIKITNKENFY